MTLADASTVIDEIVVPDAHPLGARPFGREDYTAKLLMLTDGAIPSEDQDRFLDLASRVGALTPQKVADLAVALPDGALDDVALRKGIFR